MKKDNVPRIFRLEPSAAILSALLLAAAVFIYLKRNDCNYSNIYLKVCMVLSGGISGRCSGRLLNREKNSYSKKKQIANATIVLVGLFQIIFSFVNLLNVPLDTTIIQLDFFGLNFFILFSTNLILFILSIYISIIKEE